jgi:membrane carboxypeptidase/penicillin-binding protein
MPNSTRLVHLREKRLQRKRRDGRTWLRLGVITGSVLLLVVAVGAVVLLAVAAAVYASTADALPSFTDLPETAVLSPAADQPTQIYAIGPADSQGRREPVLIYEITDPMAGQYTWLAWEQIPPFLVAATVAVEDADFWQEEGAALWINGRLQSSTTPSIPRQTIRNNLILPATDQTTLAQWQQALQEIILTRQLATTYTKEEILTWYLNTNYYGSLAYGLEAAAQIYFGKPASLLTLPESAMLAGIPQNPAVNPFDDFAGAKRRQALVLDLMVREGYITQETAVTAKNTPLQLAPGLPQRIEIIAPHFARMVQRELITRLGPQKVLAGGLKVYTTLDLTMQQQAECVARAHLNQLAGTVGALLPVDEQAACQALPFLPALDGEYVGRDLDVDNTAVIMLDPTTGQIKALVGSLDYWDQTHAGALNMAADGLRQPGTAFQPFVYLTALSQGYTAATMLLDVETNFTTPASTTPFVPQNLDGQYHGPMLLRQALGNGYNVPAVQVTSWVGVDRALQTAHTLGITTMEAGTGQYDLTLTLGGGEVKLLDMVYAFSVMDNMGQMVGQPRPSALLREGYRTLDPVIILRIEDETGTAVYQQDTPEKRDILTPQLAFLMNDILSDRSARCQAFGCPNILELPDNRPAAVVTGTTNDFRDAWTIGYTPQLVTGVWVGNADNRPMAGVTGITGAAPIWHALMAWAAQNEPVAIWQKPPGLLEMAVCDLSGLLPTPHCPTVSEYFVPGTQPTTEDTIFQEFAVNRETGRLATVYTPPELVEVRVFRVYPEAAQAWAQANGEPVPPTDFDTLPEYAPTADLAILSPEPFAVVNGRVPILGTVLGDDVAFYRLAYFAGLAPNELVSIVDGVTQPRDAEELAVWDTTGLDGLYTLLLTAVYEDGSFRETTIPVTVDNTPPEVTIIAPRPDQQFQTAAGIVVVQADASDNLGIARVQFFVDDAGLPFAVRPNPPFIAQWPVAEPGCYAFRVTAVDTAGNKSQSPPVPFCVQKNDG